MFKFGIVGTGAMGLEHIRNIALLKETCTVAAVADSDAGMRTEALSTLRLAGFGEAAVLESLEALLATDLDAIIICVPNYLHIDVLRTVVPLNQHHVLCEKPLCTTVVDCLEVERMLRDRAEEEAEEGKKKLFMVGMEYRWMPPIARLIAEVDSGSLGAPRSIGVREHRFPFLDKVAHWNRFNRYTGGTLVEKACHFFDLMRRVALSEPVSVYASGGSGVNHAGETYNGAAPDILDYALCVVNFDSGASASLDLCMFAEDEQTEWVSVVGEHGKAEARCPESSVRIVHRHCKKPGAKPPLETERAKPVTHHIEVNSTVMAAGYHEGATYFELTAFVQAALEGLAPPVSAHDGTVAVALGEAAHMSIAQNRLVKLDEILPAAVPP